jgi:hypothetical protein
MVDGGRMLKRLRPAPQGRGHRIRKRSNHITLVVDSRETCLYYRLKLTIKKLRKSNGTESKSNRSEIRHY